MDPIQIALYDELDKIAASRNRMSVPQSRSGRRPMSVETMLKKDNNGTLFKKHEKDTIKDAATRAVKEWRSAAGGGNQAGADQIAAASGQLGLKPRHLEAISGGGMEAGVDKMMGSVTPGAQGPNTGGYLARKLYKPDSPLTTGSDTSKLLAEKQRYTDTARGLSPEAKSMVPAMYGHQEIQGPGGQLRHTSDHEYVPNMQSLRADPNALAHAQRVQDVVAKPMAAKGMPMGDIARPFRQPGPGGQTVLGGNASNVGMTGQGPKVIDFLPHGSSSPVSVSQQDTSDVAQAAASGVNRPSTGYGANNMTQLRKDVYRPTAGYQHPPLAAAPAPALTPPPASSGGGWFHTPQATPVTAKAPAMGPMGTAIMPRPAAAASAATAVVGKGMARPVSGIAAAARKALPSVANNVSSLVGKFVH